VRSRPWWGKGELKNSKLPARILNVRKKGEGPTRQLLHGVRSHHKRKREKKSRPIRHRFRNEFRRRKSDRKKFGHMIGENVGGKHMNVTLPQKQKPTRQAEGGF